MTTSANENSLKLKMQLKSYARMFLASIFVVFVAWLIGTCFNKFHPLTSFWVNMLEYAGYVFWGTALADSKAESWSKCTLPEILDKRLQFLCSEMGIFVFVVAQTLTPTI